MNVRVPDGSLALRYEAEYNFATRAAQSDTAEVKLGQLAEQKSTNPAVKEFGRRMVRDHSKNETELKGIASNQNLPVSTDLKKSDQDTYDHLANLSGNAFDRTYACDMVKNHTKDVAEFENEAKNGQSQAIRHYAAQTVSTLHNHLTQAQQMEEAVQSNAAKGTR